MFWWRPGGAVIHTRLESELTAAPTPVALPPTREGVISVRRKWSTTEVRRTGVLAVAAVFNTADSRNVEVPCGLRCV